VPLTRHDAIRVVYKALGVHLNDFLALDAMLFACQTTTDATKFQISLLAQWLQRNLPSVRKMPLNA
jgi:hypothetical protein